MSKKIHDMFSGIAKTYDKANTVLSFGIHHLWRRKLIQLSDVKNTDNVLDCATGTGDLAIAFYLKKNKQGKTVGTDFCASMLEFAKEKSRKNYPEIEWYVEDAMNLSFPDNSFDIATISFGIRNVDDPTLCLKEMARVVKPGGKVIVLEFGQPRWPIKPFYYLYSYYVLPFIGGIISGNFKAYKYLNTSSAAFPAAEKFLKWMDDADVFVSSKYHRLSFGISYIYIGVVA